LATDDTRYFSYSDAALIHILLMRLSGETHYGVELVLAVDGDSYGVNEIELWLRQHIAALP
jgi:hypothetical protein